MISVVKKRQTVWNFANFATLRRLADFFKKGVDILDEIVYYISCRR